MSSSKPPPLSDLSAQQVQWIAGAATMRLASMPGQVAFIAQFNASLRTEFGLSDGQFALLFTLGTLCSAAVLVFVGGMADRIGARLLSAVTTGCLALTCLLMAGLGHVAVLLLGLILLRFFGQGLLSHVSTTSMARWFHRYRGRAVSISNLGFTLGEATLPFLLTVSILAFGWRNVWLAAAGVLVVCMIPAMLWLLRRAPDIKRDNAGDNAALPLDDDVVPVATAWSRKEVLRDPLFYVLLLCLMVQPVILTLFSFHQASLTQIKGWDITAYTALLPILPVTAAISALVSGSLVDRFGAWRLTPIMFLPLALGTVVVSTLQPEWTIPAFFVCFGLSQGMMGPIGGALWVELYGSAHIGAIRALAAGGFVAASALGPGIAGVLIDAGLPLDGQGIWYAGLALAMSLVCLLLQPVLRRRALH